MPTARKTSTAKTATKSATPRTPRTGRSTRPVRGTGVREASAQATRDAILKAAIRIFAKKGFDGGRVEEISRTAKSYDRMIYYYFDSKEGLFIAVLEEIYRRMNEEEQKLALDMTQPVEALKRVVAFMWDYYGKHPEFVTLLNTENLHRGRHISKSLRARDYSSPAISLLQELLSVGSQQGLFREGLRGRDLWLMIASLGYFYQSNRYTLNAFLGEDLSTPEAVGQWQAYITEAVMRMVLADVSRIEGSAPVARRKSAAAV